MVWKKFILLFLTQCFASWTVGMYRCMILWISIFTMPELININQFSDLFSEMYDSRRELKSKLFSKKNLVVNVEGNRGIILPTRLKLPYWDNVWYQLDHVVTLIAFVTNVTVSFWLITILTGKFFLTDCLHYKLTESLPCHKHAYYSLQKVHTQHLPCFQIPQSSKDQWRNSKGREWELVKCTQMKLSWI